tara:strand:- start:3066 stop:3404 length:339 start_codon:yes stop_codon:yes gene_type:complete
MSDQVGKETKLDQNLRTQLQYDAQKKSVAAAYILWLFLGTFGAHRFYLGRVTSGAIQLALLMLGWIPFFLGWFVLGVWWLVDAFLIPGQTEQRNLQTLDRLSGDAALPAIPA